MVDGKLVQLSWKNHLAFEYNLSDLSLLRQFDLKVGSEGWGLTHDGSTLYLTDSGHELFHLSPETYGLVKRLAIVDPRLGHRRIYGVNELEWVEGELWGNVFPMYQHKASQCIVRIDASSGHVLGWIDAHGLFDRQSEHVRRQPMNAVLNGIAYHAKSDRLYVTGKMWDSMYRIRLVSTPHGPEYVSSRCSLG